MSSNNQIVRYPDLTNSATSPPDSGLTPDVAGETVQQSENEASNESSSQASLSRRHLRSSGPVPDNSLESLFTDEVTPEQRQNEIIRILDGGPDEALSSFHTGTKAEMLQIYKCLSGIVHPDIQSDAQWKEKATQAQQSKSCKIFIQMKCG